MGQSAANALGIVKRESEQPEPHLIGRHAAELGLVWGIDVVGQDHFARSRGWPGDVDRYQQRVVAVACGESPQEGLERTFVCGVPWHRENPAPGFDEALERRLATIVWWRLRRRPEQAIAARNLIQQPLWGGETGRYPKTIQLHGKCGSQDNGDEESRYRS